MGVYWEVIRNAKTLTEKSGPVHTVCSYTLFTCCKKTNIKMWGTCTKRTRDPAHKYGFPWVQRLRSIHHKITVVQVPWADLDLSNKEKANRFQQENKNRKSQVKVITASFTEFITALQESVRACVCVCSHWPACLWWWGWTHKGTACRPLRCRHRSKPEPSSHPGTAGRRSLYKLEYNYSCCWGCTALTVTFSTFDCRSDKDVLQPQMELKSLYKQTNISIVPKCLV